MAEIGLLPDAFRRVHKLTRLTQGMVLVCGPTGAGKTSTLYALLSEIAGRGINIVTLEDPIEYVMETINQVQMNERAGLSFASSLRSVLRQDPDVIFVGEIRDRETADVALQASMTGHVVVSTIHANTAVGAITRLQDLGVPIELIASGLSAVIAQRLVRRICTDCRTEAAPDPELVPRLETRLGEELSFLLYAGRGCETCQRVGYRGRVGVYEILSLHPKLLQLVGRRASGERILEEARRSGMRLMAEDAIEKCR